MKAVYLDSSIPEKEARRRYNFPEFIMMENAAAALENAVRTEIRINDFNGDSYNLFKADDAAGKKHSAAKAIHSGAKLLIVCGTGNNGGDGLALARRITGHIECDVFLTEQPKTDEAKAQLKMAEATGVHFLSDFPSEAELFHYTIIVDCILGTGFKGELRENIAKIIGLLNKAPAYKIACDVPTGFAFKADCTVTMGALKADLFTDKGKENCGKLELAELGITSEKFNECAAPDAWLVEKSDIHLPLRKNPAAHKGKFGHCAVFAGQKSGAGILAASSALNFGAGLVTLIKTSDSNLSQFKISPEIMIADSVHSIPAGTTCICAGSGLGMPSAEVTDSIFEWFSGAKNPGLVLDADFFSWNELPDFLKRLNDAALSNGGKIILTPHPKELQKLYQMLTGENLSVGEISDNRILIGRKICKLLPAVTVVMKSANTFIAENASASEQHSPKAKACDSNSCDESGKNSTESEASVASANQATVNTWICNSGAQSLAKAGSGDVLAGMCGSLLAQGYSAKDGAITAVYAHGLAAKKISSEAFYLTPELLISVINDLD